MTRLANSLIACAFTFLAGCRVEQAADTPAVVRVDVTAAQIRKGQIEETVTATGSTSMRTESQLRSPITGVLVQFGFFNGDRVRKGEAVARVRPKEAQAALEGADELLRMAKTPQQREEAQKAAELARRGVSTAIIRAPFDGVVTTKSKSQQEVVSEGEAIASVVDPTSIIFVADVPTASLGKIRLGLPATIRFAARPEKLYRAIVHTVEPRVNPNDQTARVQMTFRYPGRDLEGSLFGEASITVSRRENVLLVPKRALLHDDEANTTSLMLIGRDSVATRVEIEVGARNDSLCEVISPKISPGLAVVTQGHYGMPDSTRVRIVK